MRFVTDARSAKAAQLGIGEVCWWFAKTNEQFRVRGTLELVTDASAPPGSGAQRARHAAWEAMRDGAREQFWWPTPAE